MTARDVIVIGGGHNGLTAAALLAGSGRGVTLVEAGAALGGPAATEEFAPGFRASTAHLLNRLHPDVVKALALDRFGLFPTPPRKEEGGVGASESPSPLWGGVRGGGDRRSRQGGGKPRSDARIAPTILLSSAPPLMLRGGYGEALDGATPSEAAAWATLRATLFAQLGVLKPFLTRRPPDLANGGLAGKAALGMAALALRRLGREPMRDFLRMLLMNVADVADEHLSDDRLKALLAFDATLGAALGPRSPTSLLGLYLRLSGEIGGIAGAQLVPKGGMGSVIASFERAARAAGAVIRTASPVARILVEQGRAVGVEFTDGTTLRAGAVVAAINPQAALLGLVGPRHLDAGFGRDLGRLRMKGNVAALRLALDCPPRFAGVAEADHVGRFVLAGSAGHVEEAFNPSKYGGLSADPVMEVVLPSEADPSLAPEGAAVLTALIPFSPYDLREGWEAGRSRLADAALAVLEVHAPGLRSTVRHAELLAPPDLERRYRLPGGHWHHGELHVDRMLVNRPLYGAAGYDTPIEGLFLASAGCHPGGGITGLPGLNAARRMMEVMR